MINNQVVAFIFINNGKSRAANGAADIKVLAQSMYKSGFAGAHLSVQGKHPVLFVLLPKRGRGRINFL